MSNSDLLAALDSAENGKRILQILMELDANAGFDPPYADSSPRVSYQDAISSDAVDFKSNPTDF